MSYVPKESFPPVPFPTSGVNVSNEVGSQPPGSTPHATNVRSFDTFKRRFRGGSRGGLGRYVNAKVGNLTTAIQHLNVIVTVSGDAMQGNFFDPEAEKFYAADPSVPAETGWAYTGDPNWPISASGGQNGNDDLYILNPSTNAPAGSPRVQGMPVPRKGNGRQPIFGKKKIRPRLTWPSLAAIPLGTALGATQLCAQALHPETGEAVAGTFAYNPAAGTVLTAGFARPLRAVFNPTNTDKYWPAKISNQIDVADYYTTSDLLKWPKVMTAVWTFGSTSWTTTATLVAENDAPYYRIDKLPHPLVDVNGGLADGLINLLEIIPGDVHPGYYGYGGSASQGYEIVAPFPPPWSTATREVWDLTVTTQNPYLATTDFSGPQTLNVAGGGTISGTLTLTVSGPAL